MRLLLILVLKYVASLPVVGRAQLPHTPSIQVPNHKSSEHSDKK